MIRADEGVGGPARAPKRGVGRPRRLTLDRIVDTAVEIGIADLDLPLLAQRLNIGVATLYGYVRGRDHLLQLVSQRLTGQLLIKDRGQGWQDILREHAAVTTDLFHSIPHLVTHLMEDESNRRSLHYSHLILDMLVSRGLTPEVALDMYVETNQVVIGAAICLMRSKSIAPTLLKAHGHTVPLRSVGNYRPTLERIIAGYEAMLELGSDSEPASD